MHPLSIMTINSPVFMKFFKSFQFFFFLSVLAWLSACDKEAKLKPGPRLDGLLDRGEKLEEIADKKEQEDKEEQQQNKKLKNVDRKLKGQSPVVGKAKKEQEQAEKIAEVQKACDHQPTDFYREGQPNLGLASDYEFVIVDIELDGEPVEAHYIRGDYMNFDLLREFFSLNGSNLNEVDFTDDKTLNLRGTGYRIEDDAPIILSTKLFHIRPGESLRTYGQDLIILAEKIILDGRIVTTPKKNRRNQEGLDGGNILLAAIVYEFGPDAQLDLRGGPAGDFHYIPPIVSDEKLDQIHRELFRNYFVKERVEIDEDLVENRDSTLEIRRHFDGSAFNFPNAELFSLVAKKARKKLGPLYFDPYRDSQFPFHPAESVDIGRLNPERYRWAFDLEGVATRYTYSAELSNGFEMHYQIPSFQYTGQLNGGRGGFLRILSAKELKDLPMDPRDAGASTSAPVHSLPYFQIPPENRVIELVHRFEFRMSFLFQQAQTSRISSRSGLGIPSQDQVLEGYQNLADFSLPHQTRLKTEHYRFQVEVDPSPRQVFDLGNGQPPQTRSGSLRDYPHGSEIKSKLEEILGLNSFYYPAAYEELAQGL